MIRVLRVVFLWIPALLALFPAYMALRFWIDWQTNCAGGRAANPGYHVADCWDTERALVYLIVLAVLLVLPLTVFGVLRHVARRKAANDADQP